ncbi:metallophosphoesterase family protein, partial [Niabella ginsengisoli]
DQIYADEVPTMLLRYMCSLDGVGIWSATASEKMKIKGDDNNERDLETDITAYPPTLRQRLVNKYAGFTSSAAANHLLTFEEFCATYLTYWNIRSWNRELHSAIKAIPDISKPEFNTKLSEAITKFVDSAAVDADVNLVNLIRDNENIRATDAYIFSDNTITKAQFRDNNDEKYKKWLSDIKASLFDEIINIAAFMNKLPNVSRILANVATYMIMDDHEITDDWFITKRWNNQVLSKPFGRDIIRNGIMAYSVFQDWGNSPMTTSRPPVLLSAKSEAPARKRNC